MRWAGSLYSVTSLQHSQVKVETDECCAYIYEAVVAVCADLKQEVKQFMK